MKKIVHGVASALLVFCLGTATNYEKPSPAELMARIPKSPVKHCSSSEGLEDGSCTPGAAITQKVSDICNGISTTTIRPPDEYTDALKIAQIKEYGYHDADPRDYEEDHLISLEIGGHPDDPKNLWPEPHEGVYGSMVKDKVEDWLHAQICAGAMTPQEAQRGIVNDWRQYIDKAGAATHQKVKEVE